MRPSAVRHARRTMLDVATAPPSTPERAAGASLQRVGDPDLVRAADADVPAASTTHERARAEQPRDAVGRVALARAAEVEPQAGRALDRAAAVVDTRPARQQRRRMGARRAARAAG